MAKIQRSKQLQSFGVDLLDYEHPITSQNGNVTALFQGAENPPLAAITFEGVEVRQSGSKVTVYAEGQAAFDLVNTTLVLSNQFLKAIKPVLKSTKSKPNNSGEDSNES
jgi:hypothetical protein